MSRDQLPTGPGPAVARSGPSRPAADDLGHQALEPIVAAHALMTDDDPRRAALRDHLVTGYLPVARRIAARYSARGEPFDDLFQVACIGLLHAINRFQPDRGCPFLGFAVPTITGEVRRHFRDRTWSMRVSRRLKDHHAAIRTATNELSTQLGRAPRPSEIAELLDMSTDDVIEGLQAGEAYRAGSLDEMLGSESGDASRLSRLGGPDPALELFTNTHSLAPAIAELPERERSILIMRFYQDMTQIQIAGRVGVSQMHVSRILSATLARLREALDADPEPTVVSGHRPPPPGRHRHREAIR